jgi:hypothetical protein
VGDTTAGQTSPEGLKLEAAELTADIKETEQEAKEARSAGNDARADRLEASLKETRGELAEIKTLLQGLTDRPFHPAPGDGETPPAQTPAEETPPAETPPAEEKPKGKRHFLFGDRWNED